LLPAAAYVFKTLDSQSDRHIVYAAILAIPNYRLQASDKTVIAFRERPAGEPEALRASFYPGRNWGGEFVYPKAKARELAKAADTRALFMPVEVLRQAPIMAIKPTGEEVQLAEVVIAPPAPTEAAVAGPAALPATAGSLPSIALFGFLALGAAIAVSVLRKQSALRA